MLKKIEIYKGNKKTGMRDQVIDDPPNKIIHASKAFLVFFLFVYVCYVCLNYRAYVVGE